MLAGLNVGRYRDRSVRSTKFAHIGKFKKTPVSIIPKDQCRGRNGEAGTAERGSLQTVEC